MATHLFLTRVMEEGCHHFQDSRFRAFLGGPVVGLSRFTAVARAQSLAGELRSCKPCGKKKKKKCRFLQIPTERWHDSFTYIALSHLALGPSKVSEPAVSDPYPMDIFIPGARPKDAVAWVGTGLAWRSRGKLPPLRLYITICCTSMGSRHCFHLPPPL